MKNRFLLMAGIVATLFIACEKDDDNPVFVLNAPPAFTAPAAGSSLTLMKAEEDNTIVFSWTPADYSLDNLPSTTYKLQIDKEGNNFASPVLLSTTTEVSYETTIKKLNAALLGMGLVEGTPANIEMRLIYDVDEAFIDTTEAVSISISPYSDVVEVKPIYILGSGTLAGWDNMAALEMTPLEDGKFEIVTTLAPGPDQFIKFISVLGQWAPQWGTDGTGIWESGPLVYRETEAVPDPASIPAPDFASQFKIIADTVNLTYQVFEYGDIWLLGGSTPAGWDNTKAVPFIKVDDGIYTMDVMLDPAVGTFWKIIDERGAWAPQWGTDATGTWESGPLVYRETEAVPDPPAIPEPPEAGMYRINVNINSLSYTVTKL